MIGRLLLIVIIATVLVACSTASPSPSARSLAEAPAALKAPAEAKPEQEEPAISETAREHFDAAVEYMDLGRPGLALTEIEQAVATAPFWREARELEGRVQNSYAAELRAQQAALVAVAQADATAAAQIQIDARGTVTAREAQQAAAAAAQAERQNQARIAAYARTAPRGHWGEQAGNVGVGVGNFSYDTDAGRFTRAARGTRYIVFGIIVENNTTRSIHVNPGNVTLVDQKGASYRYNSATFSWCNTPLQAVDVQPGNHAQGCLLFQVDSSTGPAKIIYRVNSFSGPEITINLERPPDGA